VVGSITGSRTLDGAAESSMRLGLTQLQGSVKVWPANSVNVCKHIVCKQPQCKTLAACHVCCGEAVLGESNAQATLAVTSCQ
jgi:hypothetical protein